MLKLKTGSNTGSDTLTCKPIRPDPRAKSLTRWPVSRRPGSISVGRGKYYPPAESTPLNRSPNICHRWLCSQPPTLFVAHRS